MTIGERERERAAGMQVLRHIVLSCLAVRLQLEAQLVDLTTTSNVCITNSCSV